MSKVQIFFVFVMLGFSLTNVGCIDRESPFFKQEADKERVRMTKYTEDRIAESAKLRKLDAVCRDLPYFRDSAPVRKGMSREQDTLYYYYRINVAFETVNHELTDYLLSNGWRNTKMDNEIWEYQVEFEKDNYWIQISYSKFSEDNFATNCLDKAIS